MTKTTDGTLITPDEHDDDGEPIIAGNSNGIDNNKQCDIVLYESGNGEPNHAQGNLEGESGESGYGSIEVPHGEHMDALYTDSGDHIDERISTKDKSSDGMEQ